MLDKYNSLSENKVEWHVALKSRDQSVRRKGFLVITIQYLFKTLRNNTRHTTLHYVALYHIKKILLWDTALYYVAIYLVLCDTLHCTM